MSTWEVDELGIETNCLLSILSHMDFISQSVTKRSHTLGCTLVMRWDVSLLLNH